MLSKCPHITCRIANCAIDHEHIHLEEDEERKLQAVYDEKIHYEGHRPAFHKMSKDDRMAVDKRFDHLEKEY